jgi:hypothetical protein
VARHLLDLHQASLAAQADRPPFEIEFEFGPKLSKLSPMRLFFVAMLALAVGLTACKSTSEQKLKKEALSKKTKAKLRDEETSKDVDFQAFIGRLRKAVAAHDMNAIATMMTPNFGYKLNPELAGEGVFKYWDDENLWPELEGILSEKFVTKGDFMVAPAQFADESVHYDGYRAGLRRINGSWKFVYFVNG